jgi:hypothetical protein
MIKKSIILSVVVAGAMFAGGAAYLMKDVSSTDQQGEATQVAAEIHTISHSDRPKYTNMKDLSQASDLVFVGTVEGIDGTRNLARNPQDPTQEDPNIYIEGVDYNVKVTEILKGQADSNVLVTEQKQMRLGKDQPMVPDEHYIGLTPGQSYIFFVKKSNITGRYFSVGDPFFFAIENNKAVLKTKEKDLLDIYKTEDVNLFKKAVKEAVKEGK